MRIQHFVYVSIVLKSTFQQRFTFFSGSCALFMRLVGTFFSKNNFKTTFHGTIYTFKNYFAIVFLVFSFQQ